MDMTSNNINQAQLNQNNSYNNIGINNVNSNYQGVPQNTPIDNNYMNGGKNIIPQPNNNMVHPSPPQFIPQNNNQTFWNGNYNMPMQNSSQIPAQSNNQNEKEFILLDGSSPNKKRKYVFVEEIDVTQPVFSLEDIRKIVSDEFDRRFGEEGKS